MPTPMKVKDVRGKMTMRVLGEKDKLVLEYVQKKLNYIHIYIYDEYGNIGWDL